MNILRFKLPATCIATLSIVTGCIVVPIGVGEEEPFKEEKVGFLVVGETTKQVVTREMSRVLAASEGPNNGSAAKLKIYRDGKTWLYGESRDEAKFFAIAFVPVVGAAGVVGDEDFRLLLLDFDSIGILKKYEILKSGGGCSDDGVCAQTTDSGMAFELLATSAEEVEALSRRPAEDQCSVFLFSDIKSATSTLSVSLDGQHLGLFFGDDEQYFLLTLDAGTHELSSVIGGKYGDRYVSALAEGDMFECQAGKEHFLQLKARRRLTYSPGGSVQLMELDKDKASKLIRRRHLTIFED